MTKAESHLRLDDRDPEDVLYDGLKRAHAIVHLCAQAAESRGVMVEEYHLALETVWDLLTDSEEARHDIMAKLEKAYPPNFPEGDPMAKKAKPTKQPEVKAKRARKRRKKNNPGPVDRLPGEQPLNFDTEVRQ